MQSPSDLLTLTAQESLSPSDMPQDLHESLLQLLEPSFMDSWSLLIILEIKSGFWTGTWKDNCSWHENHRRVCVVNRCDTPLELHSREKRQGNLSQSHLLAESKKKRWQELLHRPHVNRSASTIGFHENFHGLLFQCGHLFSCIFCQLSSEVTLCIQSCSSSAQIHFLGSICLHLQWIQDPPETSVLVLAPAALWVKNAD